MDSSADAIERLYHQRYAGFRHAAAAVLGDYDAAHDAVQDGFARAFAQRAKFRGGSLEGWVWQIVLRATFDLRRRHRRRPALADIDPRFIRSERDPELADAIRALPPRRRLIVFLRYFADLTYGEIAELCGVREGTVAATLAHAHADLRRSLELEGVGT